MVRKRAAASQPVPGVAEALSVAIAERDAHDRIAVGDDLRVRFITREEWEAAAWVLVESDRDLTPRQIDAIASSFAELGLANADRVITFDRSTRVRLIPGDAELRRRLDRAMDEVGRVASEKAALEHRARELEARLNEANERVAALSRSLAARARPAAVGSA